MPLRTQTREISKLQHINFQFSIFIISREKKCGALLSEQPLYIANGTTEHYEAPHQEKASYRVDLLRKVMYSFEIKYGVQNDQNIGESSSKQCKCSAHWNGHWV